VDVNTNLSFIAHFLEKASCTTQKSEKVRGRGRKNSQLCLFTGEEQSRSKRITPTLTGHHPHLTHPRTPHLQDSTTIHGDVLDSVPVNSAPIKQHAGSKEFSHGGLRHHQDGFGRRMDGFETPSILSEQECYSSPSLEMTIPNSVGNPTYSQWNINLANLGQSEELTAMQISIIMVNCLQVLQATRWQT